MRRDEVLKQIDSHRAGLEHFRLRSLHLFGSVARDEATAASDVDVLVDFEGRPDFDRYMGLKFFLEDLLGSRVDLVTLAGLKPRLREHVEREAVRAA